MTEPKRRRVRVSRNRNTKGLHARSAELQDLLELYHKQHAAAERANIKAASALADIQEIMQTNKQDKVVSEHAVAEMVVPRSNSVTTIDPKAFREAVTDDDEFYSSISVGVTAAKKVLPEKTLDKISTKKAGAKKDPVCKIRNRKADD